VKPSITGEIKECGYYEEKEEYSVEDVKHPHLSCDNKCEDVESFGRRCRDVDCLRALRACRLGFEEIYSM